MSEVDKLTLINTIIDIEYAMFDKVERSPVYNTSLSTSKFFFIISR